MAQPKMTQEQLRWQAEDDARTMARYQEIMADKPRMNRAVAAAKKEADNLEQRANAMKRAASTRKTTSSTKRKKVT